MVVDRLFLVLQLVQFLSMGSFFGDDGVVLSSKLSSNHKDFLFVANQEHNGTALIDPGLTLDFDVIPSPRLVFDSSRLRNSGCVTELWRLHQADQLTRMDESFEIRSLSMIHGVQITRLIGRSELKGHSLYYSRDNNEIRIQSDRAIFGNLDLPMIVRENELFVELKLGGKAIVCELSLKIVCDLAVPRDVFRLLESGSGRGEIRESLRYSVDSITSERNCRVEQLPIENFVLRDVEVSESDRYIIGFGILQRLNFEFSFIEPLPRLRMSIPKSFNLPEDRLERGEAELRIVTDGLAVITVSDWARFSSKLMTGDIITSASGKKLGQLMRDDATAVLVRSWENHGRVQISRKGESIEIEKGR